jgi:hypothetical protein
MQQVKVGMLTYDTRQDMDGLQMVVRFEVDACLPAAPNAETVEDSVGSLVAQLANTSLSTVSPSSSSKIVQTFPSSSNLSLTLCAAGAPVAQSRVVEMTTRSKTSKNRFSWPEAFPQLWFSQTPTHILALHEEGNFVEIKERQLGTDETRAPEVAAQPGFRKLKAVLEAIQELAVEYGSEARLSLVHKDGELRVYEVEGAGDCVPRELLRRFDS